VVAAGSLFALLMVALCTWSLLESRQDVMRFSSETQQNIALVVERDVQRNFELYNLSLDAVVDGLQQPEVMALPLGLRQLVLFDRAATAQYLGSMLVLDRAGYITIDSEQIIPRRGNFADRHYFNVQRDDPHAGLFISDPFDSRMPGTAPSIALTRRISKPDGSFNGVALLSLRLSYFENLFDGLNLGPNSAIALLKSNGVLTMRQPYIPNTIGHSFFHTAIFSHFTQPSGSFVDISPLDGIRRLYTYRKLSGLPFIVTVAVAEKDIYASWFRRALPIAILILISAFAFIVLSAMLGTQLRRRLRAETKLAQLARIDALTGLVNRGRLEETLRTEWLRAHRTQEAFAVVFVDIDHFKAYNDTYGHQAGDHTLRAVANAIASAIRRDIDTAARYGGEEFVVLLPHTEISAATLVANKLLAAVQSLKIEHSKSKTGFVSVSIGVASWDAARHQTMNAVVKAADEALYLAKAAGRNGVVAETLTSDASV
jgi:diguanylate cyclase (GGDEF)-like protein